MTASPTSRPHRESPALDARPDRAPDREGVWSPPVLPTDVPFPVGPPDPNAHHRPANQRLLTALGHYDLEATLSALRAGADPNVRSWGGTAALRIAIKPPDHRSARGPLPGWDPRFVRALLEAGADPCASCQQGNTVALMAWQYSHQGPAAMAATTWLVQHPWTDVRHTNASGSSMISMASYAPNLIATLVARGENPDRACGGTTALGASLRWGPLNAPDVIRAFVAAGADVNAHPPDGLPALPFLLHPHAASSVPVPTVQGLLAAGADPYWQGAGLTLDDLLHAHRQRDAVQELLALARYRADDRRLNAQWRQELPPALARSRSRL